MEVVVSSLTVVVNSVVIVSVLSVWALVSLAPSAIVVDVLSTVVSSVVAISLLLFVVSVYALVVLSVDVTNEVLSKKPVNVAQII